MNPASPEVPLTMALAGRILGKLHGCWQTAGVVFVADALGGWLVGQLADAGRKKLTKLVLGSDQQRALRQAADAAVLATAEEMSPPGGEQAEQVAMVISEVFRDPVPDAPLAGPVMLLEGLQAGIARQMLPSSLFEHPAAELSVDDSAQLGEDPRQPDHIV
jgi:hypothetical protein